MKKISNKFNSSFSFLSTEKIKLRKCLNELEQIALEAKEFRDLLEKQLQRNPNNVIKEPMETTSITPLRIFGRDADCNYLLQELLESEQAFGLVANTKPSVWEVAGSKFGWRIFYEYLKLGILLLIFIFRRIVGRLCSSLNLRDESLNANILQKKKRLMEPIASEHESSEVRIGYSVLSIVGVGGAGKTTLAQLVYNDDKVTAGFDLKIWLSMTRGLDPRRHTQIMIEAASKKECPRLDSLDELQNFLINLIKSKKILVMMDDVWCHETMDEKKWEQFVSPLVEAKLKSGSRILVTSRTSYTKKIPRVLLPQKIMPLKELEENYFLSLFMHHAFDGLELDSTLSQNLESIGKRIAKNLSRSPLAAKAVGSRLYKTPDEQFWTHTLEKDMLTDTMQSLLWSYQNLDAPIQRCFSFCAIFPKGYHFCKEDLILLWIAEGFIHSSTRKMEDVGGDYFEELLSVFFFQIVDDKSSCKRYVMHDLFHDLAERVSREDCFRIEDSTYGEIPLVARHLSIQGESFNEYITSVEKLKNLRTVIFIYPVSDNVINSFLKKIDKFRKMRVLEFCSCTINKLPNSVGGLVHLRYLGLDTTRVAELPTSIQNLCNLQTLKLNEMVTRLPKGLKKLVNLRHLMSVSRPEITTTLPEIDKLTSLEDLHYFNVKNEKGGKIAQLKHLNEIKGSFVIYDLKNIKNRKEATEANLKDKKHIEDLSFIWGWDDAMDGNSDAHLEVLEGLKPHPNLKGLSIKDYKSPRFPSWMFQQGSLNKLSSLKLKNCHTLEFLPPISTLFPSLRTITIQCLFKLTKLPGFPSSLKELDIEHCSSLVFIHEEELQKGDYEARLSGAIQSNLDTISYTENDVKRMLLGECQVLRTLMEWDNHNRLEDIGVLVTNLEKTEIPGENIWQAHIRLAELRMEYIYSKKEKYPLVLPSGLERLLISSCYISDEALTHCLAQLTCLRDLVLCSIRTITALPPKEVLCQLVVLDCLTILSCDYLISLGGLHALVSIKHLNIRGCPYLEIPGGGRGTLPPSLESLKIDDCCSVKHIEIRDLPSLSSATFRNCQQLKSIEIRDLPSLSSAFFYCCQKLKSIVMTNLSSLKDLCIQSCPELFELICSDMPVLVELGVEECSNLEQNFSSGILAWASIKEVRINSFRMLGKLPSKGELVNIERLSISNSTEEFFNKDEFGCLTSLCELYLNHCKVQALPYSMKNLSLLRRIDLRDCYELLSLPDMPETMEHLYLDNCPAIASLAALPKSLKHLQIYKCPKLSKQCQEPDGEDWPKISHVLQRHILL